ncbi:multidrug effflux MFS transporter [Nakamurella leprariae]|uniref:Multidrug effflux MFS transporter n=1 Tax=Nakamurella leprariae TaxID=2803911 RepID=A0A938YGH3_9ACTN|nr:multidrug effflux MFS transporter [Nakamurella leprariae]MBM9469459.1 multidrug effflux MFS transporter [Nakamurella leprariae]
MAVRNAESELHSDGLGAGRPRLTKGITAVAITLSWLGPFSLDAYSPSFPALADEFDVTDTAVQLTLSAVIFGMCLGQIIAGRLSDRFGRKGPVVISMIGYVIASVACALAPTITFLIIARFLQGLTAAGGVATARAVGRDLLAGPQLARFFSHLGAATAIAPIVGPMVGAWLLEIGSWRMIFGMITGLGVLGALMVVVLLPETHTREHRSVQARGTRLSRPSRRRVLIACGAMAFVSGALMAYLAASPFVLQDGYGLSATQYSWVFAANAVGLVTATTMNARLLRRYSSESILNVALPAVTAVGWVLVLVALLGGGLWITLTLLFLLVLAQGFLGANLIAMAMMVERSHAGRVSGLVGMAQFIIGGLTVPLSGLDLPGPVEAMHACIAVFSTVAALIYFFGRRTLAAMPPPLEVEEAAASVPLVQGAEDQVAAAAEAAVEALPQDPGASPAGHETLTRTDRSDRPAQ